MTKCFLSKCSEINYILNLLISTAPNFWKQRQIKRIFTKRQNNEKIDLGEKQKLADLILTSFSILMPSISFFRIIIFGINDKIIAEFIWKMTKRLLILWK